MNNNRRKTRTIWQDMPVPEHSSIAFYALKKPYFDAEKEFFRRHESEGEIPGMILAYYDLKTGNCTYAMPNKYGAPCSVMVHRRLIRMDQKTHQVRHVYVVPVIEDEMVVFRFFMLKLTSFNPDNPPKKYLEIFRICINGPDCWVEKRDGSIEPCCFGIDGKGAFKNDFYEAADWFPYVSFDQFQIIRDKLGLPEDISCYPLAFLTAYKNIPKNTRIYKYVPDEIRQDLTRETTMIKQTVFSGNGFLCFEFDQDRIYIDADRMYKFVWNPYEQKFVSTKKKILPIQLFSNQFLSDFRKINFDPCDFKGCAKRALYLLNDPRNILRVLYEIELSMKHVAHEQFIKLGHTSSKALYYIPSRDKGKKSLKDVLNVPGKQIKNIQFPEHGAAIQGYKIREQAKMRERLFKKAARQGHPIDRTLYYKALTFLIDAPEIMQAYVEENRNFNTFLKAYFEKGPAYGIEYRGYLRMFKEVSKVSDSYKRIVKPSALHSEHQKILRDYNRLMRIKECEKYDHGFKEAVFSRNYTDLTFGNDEFMVIAPEKAIDLFDEGAALSHCVGSYIERVTNRASKIYFLRYTSAPDTPYCTIEIVKKGNEEVMQQCYCKHDTHDDNPDRIAFIQTWAKEKNIRIACEI